MVPRSAPLSTTRLKMATIAAATRRVRETRGSYYLTRGGDTADHRSANKARRALDSAIIAEQLEEGPIVEAAPKGPVTFRIVISTQVYENYGAHYCECEYDEPCTCVDHWKAKGGDDFQRDIGSANDVIAMGAKGVQAIADELRKLVEEDNRAYRVHVIGWSLVPSDEETPGEADLREMREWGWLTSEQYEARLAKLTI